MLDPGHGGKDPGAIGVSGTYEKQVSLATALELRRQLEAEGRYRVELTRTRDAFIPLDDRVAKAQEHGAALFVSMHADALSDHSVRGASVYTLARHAPRTRRPRRWRGARTAPTGSAVPAWQRTAGGCPHPGKPGAAGDPCRLGRLARSMVGSLDSDLPMLPNPERHAGFVVLKAADIPSVLVEMGFMSNRRRGGTAAAAASRARRRGDEARGRRLFRRRRAHGGD